MLFMAVQSHTPESCPANDPDCEPLYQPSTEGVHVRGVYAVPPAHEFYFVLEADDYAAIQEFFGSGMTRCMVDIHPVMEVHEHDHELDDEHDHLELED